MLEDQTLRRRKIETTTGNNIIIWRGPNQKTKYHLPAKLRYCRMRIRKQMTVFNVTKTLYNVEKYERVGSCLTNGSDADRGVSSKLEISNNALIVKEDVETEDILVSLDPYVSVVNVSGGRAGGKICPWSIGKMFNPVPCKYGSETLFGSLESRDAAAESFHKYEWSILSNLDRDKILEGGRLALR